MCIYLYIYIYYSIHHNDASSEKNMRAKWRLSREAQADEILRRRGFMCLSVQSSWTFVLWSDLLVPSIVLYERVHVEVSDAATCTEWGGCQRIVLLIINHIVFSAAPDSSSKTGGTGEGTLIPWIAQNGLGLYIWIDLLLPKTILHRPLFIVNSKRIVVIDGRFCEQFFVITVILLIGI